MFKTFLGAVIAVATIAIVYIAATRANSALDSYTLEVNTVESISCDAVMNTLLVQMQDKATALDKASRLEEALIKAELIIGSQEKDLYDLTGLYNEAVGK